MPWRNPSHYRHRHHHRQQRGGLRWAGQVTVTMRRRAVVADAGRAALASSGAAAPADAAAIGTLGILCRFTCKQSRYAGLSSGATLGPESEPGLPARTQAPSWHPQYLKLTENAERERVGGL